MVHLEDVLDGLAPGPLPVEAGLAVAHHDQTPVVGDVGRRHLGTVTRRLIAVTVPDVGHDVGGAQRTPVEELRPGDHVDERIERLGPESLAELRETVGALLEDVEVATLGIDEDPLGISGLGLVRVGELLICEALTVEFGLADGDRLRRGRVRDELRLLEPIHRNLAAVAIVVAGVGDVEIVDRRIGSGADRDVFEVHEVTGHRRVRSGQVERDLGEFIAIGVDGVHGVGLGAGSIVVHPEDAHHRAGGHHPGCAIEVGELQALGLVQGVCVGAGACRVTRHGCNGDDRERAEEQRQCEQQLSVSAYGEHLPTLPRRRPGPASPPCSR